MEILNSKLQSPGLLNLLSRQRLVTLFKGIDQKKITLVIAGAGYGKTTLVIDALSKIKMDTIWYRLDTQDMDFMVFITYIQSGFLQKYPGTKETFGKHRIGKTALENRNEYLLGFLRSLEKKLVKKTVLVLDDYHLVQASAEINGAIEFILERLPHNLHLIIISRKEPLLRISKIRVRGQLQEIKEKDLVFTSSEINEFCSTIKNLSISNDHIKDIHEKTGGWAASLVLFSYALKDKKPEEIKKSLELFKGSQKFIFSYLEENVFETQPPDLQEFMLKICLLSVIDAKACDRIFQINTAGKMLNQMIEDHLLIFPVDTNANIFHLHHLFRDFLIEKLHQRYPMDRIRELHQKIAIDIEPDDFFQALDHYIEAHSFDAVVRLIQANEMKFLIEGKIHFLGKCLGKIPRPVIEKNPQLLFVEAKLSSYFGNPRDAIFKLKTAYKLFKTSQSNEDMVKCLIDIGSQYYCTGHVKEAKLLMEQVLAEVDETSATYIIAMTYLIFLASVLGEFDKAKRYTRQAREVILDYPEFERQVGIALINTSCSYQYFISGEFNRSQELNKKLLKLSLSLNIEAALPLVYYQYSATSFFLGKFEQGIDFAQQGLRICERIELQDSKKGWVYIAFAQNSTGLGRFEEAIDLLNQSIEIFETQGNRWGLANAWDCLHHIYLKQQKLGPAKKVLIRALDIIDSYGLTITEGILGNSMANLLILEKEFDSALGHLKRARSQLRGAGFYLFENHLLTARSYQGRALPEKAVNHLIAGLKISKDKNFCRFVEKEKEWMIPLVDSPGVTKDSKKQIYGLLGQSQGADPLGLTLNLLGRFRLFLGEKKISSSQWKSSKALLILKYLASNRGAGFIPREVLIEMLWPDQDISKTGKRFNVAMSSLRKVLEPDISPRAPSAYILRKKGSYRLCRDKETKIDLEQFLEEIQKAEKLETKSPETKSSAKAMARYLAAESWYQGPFLEEDPYEDWCIRERDRLNSKYIQVLTSILGFYEAKKELKHCVTYAKKILKTDPYDEEVVRKLMGFYASQGKRTEVKLTYENFSKQVLEIDCPINPDTKSLLKNLIQP